MLRIASRLALVLLLLFSTVVYAGKPKTIVKVLVEGEITDLHHEGDLSSSLGSLSEDVTYLNVTVTPDDSPAASSAPAAPSAPLMNDGKWCIKSMTGQTVHLTQGGSYSATLDGSFIDLEVPQAKGKPLKVSFTVFDHRWRSASDMK